VLLPKFSPCGETDMSTGYSHELYNYSYTHDMYLNFAPKFPGRYLSSNVNITVAQPDGSVVSVPVGRKCSGSAPI
jgi:hypothetical protein